LDPEVKTLVLKFSSANPLWGAHLGGPPIHGELLKLGIEISERSVSGIIGRNNPKPPSQTWKTFIKNHMMDMVAVDFLVVPTIPFRMLFVFVVLSHERRKVVYFNVLANPTAQWTAQQITEAFPWDTVPRYLLRDRDRIFGKEFRHRVRSMGIEKESPTGRQSDKQTSISDRLVELPRVGGLHHRYEWQEAA
jgi:putative transposase